MTLTEDRNGNLTFTITLPIEPQLDSKSNQLHNIFEVLDKSIPDRYELLLLCPASAEKGLKENIGSQHQAIKIIPVANLSDGTNWDSSFGDVLMVVDGDISKPASALIDVVKNLEGGSDMALLTHYTNNKEVNDPVLTCFAVKREHLSDLRRDSKGFQLLAEVFGNETMRKLVKSGATKDNEYKSGFLSGIRSLLNVSK